MTFLLFILIGFICLVIIGIWYDSIVPRFFKLLKNHYFSFFLVLAGSMILLLPDWDAFFELFGIILPPNDFISVGRLIVTLVLTCIVILYTRQHSGHKSKIDEESKLSRPDVESKLKIRDDSKKIKTLKDRIVSKKNKKSPFLKPNRVNNITDLRTKMSSLVRIHRIFRATDDTTDELICMDCHKIYKKGKVIDRKCPYCHGRMEAKTDHKPFAGNESVHQ